MKLPFNNPGKVIVLILIVIALFVSYEVFAEDDHLEIGIGPTFTSQFNGGAAISLGKRFHRNVDVGVTLISEQSWENVTVGNNGTFWAKFVTHRPENWTPLLPSEVHIGANYWFKVQPPINGAKEGFLLALVWDLPQPWAWLPDNVTIDHRSNAGTNKPNRGQDMLMFNWRL